MSESISNIHSQRRGFIRLCAIGTMGLAMPSISWALTDSVSFRSGGKLYRGKNGRLFISLDAGKNWKPVANFGKTSAIINISKSKNGWIKLDIQHNDGIYSLYSKNDHSWISKDYDSTPVNE